MNLRHERACACVNESEVNDVHSILFSASVSDSVISLSFHTVAGAGAGRFGGIVFAFVICLFHSVLFVYSIGD